MPSWRPSPALGETDAHGGVLALRVDRDDPRNGKMFDDDCAGRRRRPQQQRLEPARTCDADWLQPSCNPQGARAAEPRLVFS